MEIEYSQEVKGKVFAFRFENWEQALIIRLLNSEIVKIHKKIRRVQNDPRNEGQVKYQVKVDDFNREIKCISDIINAMAKNIINQ